MRGYLRRGAYTTFIILLIGYVINDLLERAEAYEAQRLGDQFSPDYMPLTGYTYYQDAAFYQDTALFENSTQCPIHELDDPDGPFLSLMVALLAYSTFISVFGCILMFPTAPINESPLQIVGPEENEHERRLREIGYEGEIPEAFIDPVWKSIMYNPVILITSDHTTSHSFDEMTALNIAQTQSNPVCPLTRRPFSGYILNRDLKQIIQDWVDKKVAELSADWTQLPREQAKLKMLEASRFFATRRVKEKQPEANHESYRRRLV
jgi:hypothetical protein